MVLIFYHYLVICINLTSSCFADRTKYVYIYIYILYIYIHINIYIYTYASNVSNYEHTIDEWHGMYIFCARCAPGSPCAPA